MRTVFCQKPCCQGTQVWTQQVQGLHPHPPQQPLPSKVCRPGMTGPALGTPGLGHSHRPERRHCQERRLAWRGAPEEPAQMVTPVAPSATTREPGGPSAPRARGAWPAHHAVHHADVARVPAQPAVHVPAEAVQAAEARGPPGPPAAVGDLQGGRLTSGVQTWASPHNPTPPAPGVQRTREPGSAGHGQSCRDCCVRAASTS